MFTRPRPPTLLLIFVGLEGTQEQQAKAKAMVEQLCPLFSWPSGTNNNKHNNNNNKVQQVVDEFLGKASKGVAYLVPFQSLNSLFLNIYIYVCVCVFVYVIILTGWI